MMQYDRDVNRHVHFGTSSLTESKAIMYEFDTNMVNPM